MSRAARRAQPCDLPCERWHVRADVRARVGLALGFLVLALGCAGRPTAGDANALAAATALAPYTTTQLAWVSAACSDGGLVLSQVGFERTLRVQTEGKALRLVYDQRFAEPMCERTEIWTATRTDGERYRFVPDAIVTNPEGESCGADVRAPEQGLLRITSDGIEEVRFASPWCRGFDVRFQYVRVPDAPLAVDEVLRHYVALWNTRDAAALSELFAEDGVLIEPMTRTDAGQPAQHKGRAAIHTWLEGAFATTPWLGLQLQALEHLDDASASSGMARVLMTFRYIDPRLAKPTLGRTLFLFVGNEILSAELQWLSTPTPAGALAPGASEPH